MKFPTHHSYRYERHLVFPKLFASRCSDFHNDNMIFNADDRKQGTARRYLCNRLSENVNVYTLQVSMHGYYIKGTNIATPYTEADCKNDDAHFLTLIFFSLYF